MTRYKLFDLSQWVIIAISVTTGMYWFLVIPALQQYVFIATTYKVWGYIWLRKQFFRHIFRSHIVSITSAMSGAMTYPILINLEFNPRVELHYIARGHNGFINWFNSNFLEMIKRHLLDAITSDINLWKEKALDPETAALMKEAFQPEYFHAQGDMADEQDDVVEEAKDILKQDKDLDDQL